MSKLKFQFPLSAPRRDDGTLLPATLVAVLALVLLGQALLPAGADLPQPVMPAPVTGPGRANGADSTALVVPVRADPQIVTRNLFAPGRTQSGAVGKVPGTALGGAIVAGTLGSGARMRVVVVKPGGVMTLLPRGGAVNGWQLVAIATDHAEFRRGADHLAITYGGNMPQNADSGERTEP